MASEARHDGYGAHTGGSGHMRTTTVRFPPSMWAELKARAEADGVAAAQYIREATIQRIAREEAVQQVRGELGAELAGLDELRARLAVVEGALRRLLGHHRR